MEYAVVQGDVAYNDGQIVWRAPHLLEMSDGGFSCLLVNSFLDLEDRLVEGFDSFGDKDDTLQEKIYAYLLHIGVTEQELQSIRDIWLE